MSVDIEHRFPSWLSLVELWLKTHYAEVPCTVFATPCNGVPVLKENFATADMGLVINAEYAILPCKDTNEAVAICNATPEGEPYTMAWDGNRIVSENT